MISINVVIGVLAAIMGVTNLSRVGFQAQKKENAEFDVLNLITGLSFVAIVFLCFFNGSSCPDTF